MNFQHGSAPCGDYRYYKNIPTCSVTLPVFGVIRSRCCGRNHNEQYGVIELSVDMPDRPAGSAITAPSLRGQISALML